MDPILAFLTQPLNLLLIAVGIFTGRVYFMARKLKAASRNLTLADLRALEDAKASLDKHRESLADAKAAMDGNLGGARDTLRTYKRTLNQAVEDRRKDIKSVMGTQSKEFERAQKQEAFADAKKLYKTALPRKTHRSPTKQM